MPRKSLSDVEMIQVSPMKSRSKSKSKSDVKMVDASPLSVKKSNKSSPKDTVMEDAIIVNNGRSKLLEIVRDYYFHILTFIDKDGNIPRNKMLTHVDPGKIQVNKHFKDFKEELQTDEKVRDFILTIFTEVKPKDTPYLNASLFFKLLQQNEYRLH